MSLFHRTRARVLGAAAVLSLLALLTAQAASAQPLPKINIGVSTLSTDWLPIFVADKRGFFKAAGVDATVTPFQSGNQAFAALSSGDMDMIGGAANRGVIAKEKGLDIIAVLAQNDGFFFKLMVTERGAGKVKTVADLKGKRIAAKPGALSETLLKFVLAKNNIKVADVEIVGVPNESAELALVQRGEVDAVMTGEPTATIYDHKKLAHSLIDFSNPDQLNKLGWSWIQPTHVLTVMARNDYLKKSPDTARKALGAIQKALAAIHADPEIAIKTWAEMSPGQGDAAITRDSVRSLVNGWSKNGRLLESGMDNLQSIMVSAEMQKAKLPFKDVATNAFLQP